MAKTLTEDQIDALKAARKAAKWVVTEVDIGNGWTIKHIDPYNYQLYDSGEPSGYFSTIKDAMISAVRKSVGRGVSGNLTTLCDRIDAVEAWVKSPAFGWEATKMAT